MRIVGVDPEVVVVAVRRGHGAPCLAAVGGLAELLGAHPDRVGVLGVCGDVGVVERARDQLGVVAGEGERFTGVVGAIQSATRLGFDEHPNDVRIDRRDGDIALAHELIGQAIAEFLPGGAPIRGLVDAAFVRAGDDGPRLAFATPHRGVQRVGIARLELDVDGAGGVGDIEDALPCLGAVCGTVEATVVGGLERVADGSHEGNVGVGRMNADAADVADGREADVLPRLARVGGLVDAVANGDVRAKAIGARAGVDDVGVRERDLDGAHGADGEELVGDVHPGLAGVGGAPDATAGGAHIEGMGLAGDAGDGSDAPPRAGPTFR